MSSGTPDGSALSLLTGADLYLGADDNLDSGEHDGVTGKNHTAHSVNGPSDGGNVEVGWHPLAASNWARLVVAALSDGSVSPWASNPVPVADGGGGACADGICVGAYSAQRTIYRGGGGSGPTRDAYTYGGKTWAPYNCNSGDNNSELACMDPSQGGQPGGMDVYHQREAAKVLVQPGVQLYEDPDPQGSPVLPTSLYPLPAFYVGTCGVVVGGGGVILPAAPMVNKAGQLVLAPTGC
jgi:hypothetical protein